jgi:hypothetical protein
MLKGFYLGALMVLVALSMGYGIATSLTQPGRTDKVKPGPAQNRLAEVRYGDGSLTSQPAVPERSVASSAGEKDLAATLVPAANAAEQPRVVPQPAAIDVTGPTPQQQSKPALSGKRAVIVRRSGRYRDFQSSGQDDRQARRAERKALKEMAALGRQRGWDTRSVRSYTVDRRSKHSRRGGSLFQ